MPLPLVTIVTPSMNQAEFLRATIESVLSQDYPNVEYIIMDGGSTDGSHGIAAEYSSRLTWVSEKDSGQSQAINKGFRAARGEIVAWLNSDDVLLEGAITHAAGALTAQPLAGAVYGEGYLIDRAGNITRRFPYTQPFDLWRLTHLSDYILQQSVFFRKKVVENLGFLREDLHFAMDWDLLIRIGKQFPLVQIPQFLGCLREYPETKSSSGGRERVREIRSVLREHTGRRFPPGWVVYALETYRQVWCDRARQAVPPPLAPLGRAFGAIVSFACGYMVGRTIHLAQGWYPDGWAAPRLSFMLPAGRGAFRIRGTLPASGWLSGQSIEVLANGQSLGRHPLACGSFAVDVPVPDSTAGQALSLEIRASHSFVPAFSTSSTDFRRLSFLLQDIDWVPPGAIAGPPENPVPRMVNHAHG